MNFTEAIIAMNQGKRVRLPMADWKQVVNGNWLEINDNAIHWHCWDGKIELAQNTIASEFLAKTTWEVYTDEQLLADLTFNLNGWSVQLAAKEAQKTALEKDIYDFKGYIQRVKAHLNSITDKITAPVEN